MKLININNSKNQTIALKASVFAMLFLFGGAQLANAQELLAMLDRSSVSFTSYDPADTNSVKTTKVADKTPVFDIMGSSAPLEESLIMDFSAKKKMNADAAASLTSEEAHPKAGWSAFQKYMSTVAISSDGKCGDVKLSFTIDANGVINDCKVVTGLSEAADKKAVELIKNGPSWVNAAEAKQVSVTINFHKLHTDQPDFL
jgi:TonB family protein